MDSNVIPFYMLLSLRCILAEEKVAFIHLFVLQRNLSLSSHITKKIKAANKIGWKNTVSSHVLSCWPMISEADIDSMEVEIELYCQYPLAYYCHAAHGSRGTI